MKSGLLITQERKFVKSIYHLTSPEAIFCSLLHAYEMQVASKLLHITKISANLKKYSLRPDLRLL